jgi:hypothetical protein
MGSLFAWKANYLSTVKLNLCGNQRTTPHLKEDKVHGHLTNID